MLEELLFGKTVCWWNDQALDCNKNAKNFVACTMGRSVHNGVDEMRRQRAFFKSLARWCCMLPWTRRRRRRSRGWRRRPRRRPSWPSGRRARRRRPSDVVGGAEWKLPPMKFNYSELNAFSDERKTRQGEKGKFAPSNHNLCRILIFHRNNTNSSKRCWKETS